MADVIDGATFMAEQRLKWREKEFQREVLSMAKDYGWTHRYHSYFSDRSERGFPDAVLVRPATHQILFVEFKTMRGRLTAAQESWLEALSAAQGDGTVRVCLWRPCCWNSGEIEKVLR